MGEPRRIRIIVNPSAHSGRAGKVLRLAGKSPLKLEWVESSSAAHLADLVRAAQDDDLDAVAVAGGDGTVALALAGLDGPNRVPLAVLPAGSGNDFARDLGIPRSLPEAFAVLSNGVPRWVDAGRTGMKGPRYCCVASVGLDALALRIIHGSWLPRSKALNIVAALQALCVYRPQPMRITWQAGSFEGEVMFAAVTNTRGYGGGFMVSPAARLDDGRLDLCIVRRMGKGRLLRNFPRIFQGTHGAMPEVILASSPWVRIEGVRRSLPVALDGELPRAMTPIELHCEPRAFQVLTPPDWRKPCRA